VATTHAQWPVVMVCARPEVKSFHMNQAEVSSPADQIGVDPALPEAIQPKPALALTRAAIVNGPWEPGDAPAEKEIVSLLDGPANARLIPCSSRR
jgi:hypothetical protein